MPVLTPDAWVQIRHDYEHTERPIHEICAEHGISSGTLRDRMRRWKWARRRPLISAEGPPPLPAPVRALAPPPLDAAPSSLVPDEADATSALPDAHSEHGPASGDAAAGTTGGAADTPPDPRDIAPRLQAAVARVLPAIEATLARLVAAPMRPREMEQTARALGTMTRTLRELNALLGQYPLPDPSEDRGPEDHDEFLRDLARRMDYFAETRAAARAED